MHPLLTIAPSPTTFHGTVAWFSEDKGFGFIKPRLEGPTVFVHSAAVADAPKPLVQGELVTYQLEAGPKGAQATNVLHGWLELTGRALPHATRAVAELLA
ncbi:MAG: cold shock DNA/RNA-binding protein [Thermoleophilia bacterium]|nr:cold shock DNA/RNA-binding protein [Thermoleophilia bacterium]